MSGKTRDGRPPATKAPVGTAPKPGDPCGEEHVGTVRVKGKSPKVGQSIAIVLAEGRPVVVTSQGELGPLYGRGLSLAVRCLRDGYILSGLVTDIAGDRSSATITYSGVFADRG